MVGSEIMRVVYDNSTHEHRSTETLAVSPQPTAAPMTEKRPRSALGELLFEMRSRKRFTLRELGDAAGVSGAYIGQIENATPTKPLVPSLKILRLIADGLGEGDKSAAEEAYFRLGEAAGYFTGDMLPDSVVREDRATGLRPDYMPIEVLTRGVRNSPDLPDRVKRAVIEMFELTEEINRKAIEEMEEEGEL